MKKYFLIILTAVVILSVSLLVFIHSHSFLTVTVNFINNHSGFHVEIGSLSFGEGHRIIIKDLVIEEKKKDGFHLILPYSEIRARLKGIIRKNIEEIILVRPRLSFVYKTDKKGKTSFPFTFNKVSVNDADVTLQLEKGKPFHVYPITISLDRLPNDKNAELRGSAFISELGSNVSLTAEIDTEKFVLDKAHVDVSSIDLADFSATYPTSFLKDKDLKGVGDIGITVSRKDIGGYGKITWQSLISIYDLIFRSKTMSANFKDKPVELSSQGVYDLTQDTLEIESLSARLSQLQLLALHGAVKRISSGAAEIDIIAESKNIPLHAMKHTVSGPAVKWLDGTDTTSLVNMELAITGELNAPEVSGELSLLGGRLAWKGIELRSFAMKLPFEYRERQFTLKEASFNAGEFSYLNLSDKVDPGYKLQNIRVLVPNLKYEDQEIKADNFRVNADRAVILTSKKDYAEKALSVKGTIEGDMKKQWFHVTDLFVDTDLAKGITGDIFFVLNKQRTIDATFKYGGINVEQLSQTLFHDFLIQKGLKVKGGGALQVALKVTIPENSAPQLSGSAHLNLLNAGFSSSDGVVAAEGIDMKVSNNFEFLLPAGRIDFTLYSEAANFELLIGRFYGNFRDKALSFSAKGHYTKQNDSVQITESKLGLTHIGNIFMSGTVSKVTESPLIEAAIKITDLVNSEAYNFFIRDTFQEQYPIFSQLDVNGKSSADLHIKGTSGRFTARGDFQAADMNISNKSPDKAIRGISLTLPVVIEYPEASQARGTAQFGSLRIKDAVWSGIKLKDVEVDPSVWENDVIFRRDITVPVFGGEIILRDISYDNIFSPERQLGFSVDIKNIDLEKASVAFSLPRFNGKLSGNIPRANLYQNKLLADGEINIDLFGGSIRISNLSVDNVFSPVASLKASIEFNGIDLGQLTNTFDFGHVSGLIRGKINDLVIVNGQAQHFNVFLESYKKKGVNQIINVEALKKISILGTGSSPSILDRGIYRFFREYKYEKLGFRASLENDNLLLLGIETEGNKGYIVKSGLLPPKVDVINYVQNISFKEMVSRLKRIKQAKK